MKKFEEYLEKTKKFEQGTVYYAYKEGEVRTFADACSAIKFSHMWDLVQSDNKVVYDTFSAKVAFYSDLIEESKMNGAQLSILLDEYFKISETENMDEIANFVLRISEILSLQKVRDAAI